MLNYINIITKLLISACLFIVSTNVYAIGKIAIIIDDMGNNLHNQAFLDLPKNVAFSILPFTPFSKKIAYSAHQQNREVLLHIPMQAHSHNHLLGEGALTSEMTKQEHQQQLSDALDVIPYAIGVNNHMGSQLTEDGRIMQWTMSLLYNQGLFFVDSFTSVQSVAERSAVAAGLPDLRRHVFLDNVRTPEAMEKQFQAAIQHSIKSPYTIIIAHSYPETLLYLSQRLATIDESYQLTPLKDLISIEERVILLLKKVQYYQQNLLPSDINTAIIQ